MDIETCKTMILRNLSTRDIAKETGLSQTTVSYWLKLYNLSTSPSPKGRSANPYKCACGETDRNMFYGNKRTVWGKCHNNYTMKKGQEKRKRIVEYMGGKCIYCGFCKYTVCLAVHHTNPQHKDKKFSQHRGWNWERIKEELKDCVLLCSNCHLALHCGEISLSDDALHHDKIETHEKGNANS